jgi:membrane-bound metal-dependent hydrolase YbcI (DUF457 family)
MATPIGHALAGYAVCSWARGKEDREGRDLLILCVVLAMAPDLDFLPGLFVGTPALFHQGVTHSIGFALAVSLGTAGMYHLGTRRRPFYTVFSLGFLAYTSHLLLDYLGPDAREPYGIPVLWPLSGEHFISPIPILLGSQHAETTSATTVQWIQGILDIRNLGAMAWEIALVAAIIFLGRWYEGRVSTRREAC